MQLVSLKVYHNGDVIRHMTFKEGVNIITNVGEGGNQIGKSTALRVIAFCLGSDGKDMWKDPDNNNENIEVKNFIVNNDVLFELRIKNTIEHILIRKLYEVEQKRGRVIKTECWINDVHLTSLNAYKKELSNTVFGYSQDNPSFNSIKSKFTRIDRSTSNNSLRYLSLFTSDADYTLIYSALFGFEGHSYLKQDVRIKNEAEKHKRRIDAILDGRDLMEVSDAIKDIDIEIEHYRAEESEVDMSAVQGKIIDELKHARGEIAEVSSEIAGLETRLIYNNRTIDKYHENIVSIDLSKVHEIYKEALGYVPDINKTIEETISFHNAIFIEKANQSEKRNEKLKSEIALKKEVLSELMLIEQKIIKELSSDGQLGGIVLIEKEIQSLSEDRGRLAYVFDEVKKLTRRLRELSLELQEVKDKIEDLTNSLKGNIDRFNEYFSHLTRMLFKKHANSLNVNLDEKNDLRFSIVNADKNTGDGAPRAEAMAFDLSIAEYMRDTRAKLPYFTLQDYLESVDEDKLKILLDYSNDHKVQVVLAVLNDKLQLLSEEFMKKNTILELSPDDKFFKI
ncbi:DUF2326 domain-containing protein [Serratia marcescens]|nr:DUF2326 domain-containing protein [Serratia marcescens]ELJ5815501.1 DUF2326 domain-containing protein [Serratia marcescens]ELN8908341.1 DUF2326 domain-containing protein [Serratia marcescens]ELT0474201.1 DUF2326 domain-containing protein [Serratia marcescens]EMB2193468.1 DUF2326 domain-containing protein [Serratia marcescens]